MIRISKQADYGILLLGHFAKGAEGTTWSARELAEKAHLSPAMVAKVLKMLEATRSAKQQDMAEARTQATQEP